MGEERDVKRNHFFFFEGGERGWVLQRREGRQMNKDKIFQLHLNRKKKNKIDWEE